MAGYGVNTDWIQEYESLIGRKLKEFTIADSSMVNFFEVNHLYYNKFKDLKIEGQMCLSVCLIVPNV